MNIKKSKSKPRKGIQSIEIGFQIINTLIKTHHPLSLKDLSIKCKMTPSKVHSYLVSFTNIGLVEQNGANNFYSLGSYALKMGLTYINQFNILAVAQPIMNEIAHKLGHTVFLGIWGNKGPCIIFRVDGKNSQAFLDLRIGCVLPILSSALGLNFASHIPYNIVEPFIKEELRLKSISEKFKNLEHVLSILEIIKKRGYSYAKGSLFADFSAISVPIFDYSKIMLAGLTIMGNSENFNDEKNKLIIETLHKQAKIISQKLGY